MRVIDFIDHGLSLEPNRDCLRDKHSTFTHREVMLASHRIAHALSAAGLAKGSPVAFFVPNCAVAVIAMIAVFRAGMIWLPVHPRNAAEENAEFMAANECEFLFYHSRTAADAEKMKAGVPTLKGLLCLDVESADGPALLDWSAGFPEHYEDLSIAPNDTVWIKGTGGTTGRSKSVMISNRSAVTLFTTYHWCMPIPSGHIHLAAAPISHGAGTFSLCSLCNGGTIVLIDKAEPGAVLDAIEAHRVTTVFLPPTVVYGILDRPDVRTRDYSSLKHLIYTSAPISADRLHEALGIFGPVLTQIFGQTEAPAMVTYMSPEEHLLEDGPILRKRLTSCGRKTPFVKLAIMDDEGNILGPNEVGEIVVRSELVMKGYRDNPEENEKASRFGWHHTGDVGTRDDDGYFYIVDRKKDMIISGGFNIFPSEIEQVLWSHPSVLDCAVVGTPHPKWGEAVTAVIQLKSGAQADTFELQSYCRERLGGMKTPKRIEIWDELPRSSVGKVLKKDIREHFWSGQARRV